MWPFAAARSLLAADDYEKVRDQLEPLLSDNCYECHDDTTTKGGLNLLDLEFEPGKHHNFELWARVYDRVKEGEMPPKKKERPEKTQMADFLKSLKEPLLAHDIREKTEEGRVQVRRLTRTEYEHTIHDLLSIEAPLKELLPEDRATHGFETVASGQQFSHFNLARFLDVADIALGEAFSRVLEKEESFQKDLTPFVLGKGSHRGGNFRGPDTQNGESISWPMRLQFYGRMPATRVPRSGWYEITIKQVRAVNPKRGVVWGTLNSGYCASNAPMMNFIDLVEATEEKRDLTFRAWIEEDHMLELKPNDNTYKVAPSGATGGNVSYKGRNLTKEGFRGIAHSGISLKRVYPAGPSKEVRESLFPGIAAEIVSKWAKDESKNEIATRKMEETILRFANRAFRRPVEREDIEDYLQLARDEHAKKGSSPIDGIQAAYRAILCSPRFLTFVEEPGKLDDHALASRLSYMLWNTLPDHQLRKLADEGKLSDPKVRHAQASRLLDDERSERFINSFTDQWLNLKEINFTSPDRKRFGSFDQIVNHSILEETRTFVSDLVSANRDISNIVKSDHAMLNERLIRFYGLENKIYPKLGEGIQKLNLKGDLRGGLVTQSSVLKVTADGSVTSPVIRGVYMAERILGLEIPPPPPGVPAVEPDIRGAVSIRDQLDKHRNSEDCASCHLKLDPAGFALEVFDPVGLWRTKYGTSKSAAKVDPSGITPDGIPFEGLGQWKNIYSKKKPLLTKGFVKQLLPYATGAPVRFSDRADVDKIVARAEEKNYGIKSIIHGVIASELFLTK